MAARRAIGDILIGFLGAREFKASYPITDIIHSLQYSIDLHASILSRVSNTRGRALIGLSQQAIVRDRTGDAAELRFAA
jgi:hypothetical protein